MNYGCDRFTLRSSSASIISIGDGVGLGRYQVHSRFGRVINLFNGRNFFSIATADREPGPTTMLSEGLNLAGIDEVEVTRDTIAWNGGTVSRCEVPLYSSAVTGTLAGIDAIRSVALALRREVFPLAPSESLIGLIGSVQKAAATSGFAAEMAKVLRAGAAEFQQGDLFVGARTMRGCGFGLTPSGDDFIAGFLAGMAAFESLGGRRSATERAAIVKVALGDNELSNHFLRLAADGALFGSLRDTVSGTLTGALKSALAGAARLLRVGETSGADMLMGFVIFIEREMGQCQFR